MGRKLSVTTASTSSPLITKTGFKGYDYCTNPYVGCGFGCSFCYVRFFVKDPEHNWGDFVRVRQHVFTKLTRELKKGKRGPSIPKVNKKGKAYNAPGPILKNPDGTNQLLFKDKRLVIGTMTDPYQPIERKNRVTRQLLKTLLDTPIFSKVGIFTRSPIVLEDLDLIKQLPRARVHYSISPFPTEAMRAIEPLAIQTSRRLDTIKQLKEAGLRVHVNVAPAIPHYSESMTEELARKLGALEIDEFFVDPFQPYNEAFVRMSECMEDDPSWAATKAILSDKPSYLQWKERYWDSWKKAWSQHGSPETLAIWSDHENHVWRKLVSGEKMDPALYGDDLDNLKP
jgi:DNA repair photolyase